MYLFDPVVSLHFAGGRPVSHVLAFHTEGVEAAERPRCCPPWSEQFD